MAGKSSIILDTNWYVSATINKQSRRRVFNILNDSSNTIIFSSELLAEYQSVIQRDKFKKLVKPEQVKKYLMLVLSRLKEVTIKSTSEMSRDKKDNYLVALSADAKADYLITGDVHLLELKQIGKTKVLTLTEYEQLMIVKKGQ